MHIGLSCKPQSDRINWQFWALVVTNPVTIMLFSFLFCKKSWESPFWGYFEGFAFCLSGGSVSTTLNKSWNNIYSCCCVWQIISAFLCVCACIRVCVCVQGGKGEPHIFKEKSFKKKRQCSVCRQNIDNVGSFCRGIFGILNCTTMVLCRRFHSKHNQ